MADLRGWFNFRLVYDWVAEHFAPLTTMELPGDSDVTIAPRIVEIGVWKGASIIYLCQRLLERRVSTDFDLFAVDPFNMETVDQSNGGDEYNAQLQELTSCGGQLFDVFSGNVIEFGLQDFITVMRMEGVQAAPKITEADFVFIDGCHKTDSVVADIESWKRRAGILAGHDAYQDSVREALIHCFGERGYWASVESGGCWTTDDELGRYMVGLSDGTCYQNHVVEREPQPLILQERK